MRWYRGLEPIVKEQVRLADRTWYRLGGAARYLCTPQTVDEVVEIVRRAEAAGLPYKVLGGGANVLVRDEGFDGIVMQLDGPAFRRVRFNGRTVVTGAAADLPDVVRRTVARAQAGLEFMAGIPGTVGGAVRMNAGGRFGEIGQSVDSVLMVDRVGNVHRWGRQRLHFGYRTSNLRDCILIEVTFALTPQNRSALGERYKTIWNYKKKSQPFTRNNAGCVFKNPDGHHAGELIDRAGLKGATCGGATVCEQHANFIVTGPEATSRDILTLVDRIQGRVFEQFGVRLELEVDVW